MIPAAVEHALREYPRESCGLVVQLESGVHYMECRNLADGADHFIMDPLDYILADETGDIVGVVHSHPDATAEPSEFDIAAQKATGVPWHIISVPGGQWHTFGDN